MSARYPSSTATVKDIAAPNRLTPSLLKRKTANNIGLIPLLTMAILPGLFSTAGCTEAVKGTEKNEASPVTAENYPSKEAQQAAWNNILPLISKRGGYMEPHELEQALGIKLHDDGSETTKRTIDRHTYTASPSPAFPWNMNIQIFRDKQKIKEKPWSGFEIFSGIVTTKKIYQNLVYQRNRYCKIFIEMVGGLKDQIYLYRASLKAIHL